MPIHLGDKYNTSKNKKNTFHVKNSTTSKHSKRAYRHAATLWQSKRTDNVERTLRDTRYGWCRQSLPSPASVASLWKVTKTFWRIAKCKKRNTRLQNADAARPSRMTHETTKDVTKTYKSRMLFLEQEIRAVTNAVCCTREQAQRHVFCALCSPSFEKSHETKRAKRKSERVRAQVRSITSFLSFAFIFFCTKRLLRSRFRLLEWVSVQNSKRAKVITGSMFVARQHVTKFDVRVVHETRQRRGRQCRENLGTHENSRCWD